MCCLYEGGEVEHQFQRPRVYRRERTWENGSGEVWIKVSRQMKIWMHVSKQMPMESEGVIQITLGARIASSKSLLFSRCAHFYFHPSICYTRFLLNSVSRGANPSCQWGEGRVTAWTSHRFITGPLERQTTTPTNKKLTERGR